MIGRRSLVGGGALAVALAGLGYRVWDRGVGAAGEGPAYEPWRTWEGGPEDGLLRPLRAAILAANPHDTQPWVFATGPEAIEVFADRSRNLGSFDPFRREMHLGLGAAIENLALAARAYGMRTAVEPTEGKLTLSPDDAPFRAARVVLRPVSARAMSCSPPSLSGTPTAAPTGRISRSDRTGCGASRMRRRPATRASPLSRTTPRGAISARSSSRRPAASSTIPKCPLTARAGSARAHARSPPIATG